MALLLDTCAVIWIFQNEPVRESTADLISYAIAKREPVYVSPVTAWELGMLVSRGRLKLPTDPQSSFDRMLQGPDCAWRNYAFDPDFIVLLAGQAAEGSGRSDICRNGSRIRLPVGHP